MLRLLLDPLVTIEGQNNINQPPVPVVPGAASKPSTVPDVGRKPTEAELKTEFKLDPSLFPDEPTFKVEQLPAAKPVTPTPPNTDVKPKVEAKKEEVKPAAPAKVEEVKPEPKKSLADGPISALPKTDPATPFDYSGYTEMQQQHLKKMSNEAREYAVSIIKENRELSKLKGGEFMQHPEAYRLSPEYAEASETAAYASAEANHWEEQLIRVEAGQEWHNISYDDKGKMVLGPPQKPDGRIKIRMQEALTKCRTIAERAAYQQQQLQTTYTERVKQDAAGINALRAKSFGWVADPKGLDQVVDIGGGNEKTIKQIREDFISMFPPYLRGTIGVEVAADCFVGIQIYGQSIRALESQTKIAEIKTQEMRRAEPSATERPQSAGGGKAIRGVTEFTLAGMPQ